MKAAIALALLIALPAASAYEEEEAPRVRLYEAGLDDVARVWHEPEIVQPGTQWEGFIQFRDGHRVMEVLYQICDVGRVCFAPPTPAEQIDNNTWTFNTTDYRGSGADRPIHYEAGWRIGTQYILTEETDNGTVTRKFPEGLEKPEDLEFHYFAFDMPEAKAKGISGPGGWLVLMALIASAWRRR